MRLMLLVVVGWLLVPVVHADMAADGHWLMRGWQAAQALDRGVTDRGVAFTAGGYLGFVQGVYLSMSPDYAHAPASYTQDQLGRVVGRYLEEHPEYWSGQAFWIVHTAYTRAWGISQEAVDRLRSDIGLPTLEDEPSVEESTP